MFFPIPQPAFRIIFAANTPLTWRYGMRNNALKKWIPAIVPLALIALSFANTAGADMSAKTSDRDMAITSMVREKLQSDSHLRDSGIYVETMNGEVTLKGTVNSQADITRAGKLAHYVDGVKRVDNRLSTVNSHHYGLRTSPPGCPIGASWC
jgi:hypothetical protein